MNIGLIKWFDNSKGYGVIVTDEIAQTGSVETSNDKIRSTLSQKEVFLHFKNWVGTVKPNDSNKIPIIFDIVLEKERYTALNCRYIGNLSGDWDELFRHLGKKEVLKIREDRKTSNEYNIIKCAFAAISENFNTNILSESLERIFESMLIENIIKEADTLLKVRKETKNNSLKKTIDGTLSKHICKITTSCKIELLAKELISASVLSEEELLENLQCFTIKDIVRIDMEAKSTKVTRLLLDREIKELDRHFDIERFATLLDTLDSLSLRQYSADLLRSLNNNAIERIAESVHNVLCKICKKTEDCFGYNFNQIYCELSNFKTIIDKLKKHEEFVRSEVIFIAYKAFEDYLLLNLTNDFLIKIKDLFSDPEQIIINRVASFSDADIRSIFSDKKGFTNEFKKRLLTKLSTAPLIHKSILWIAKNNFSVDEWEQLDKKMYEQLSEKEYFSFWAHGEGKIVPNKYLFEYFDDSQDKYSLLHKWIDNDYLSRSQAETILEQKLKSLNPIRTKIQFQTAINIIKYFGETNPEIIKHLTHSNQDTYILILWFLELSDQFDFKHFKERFINFNPNQQVNIIKKIFMMKQEGSLDFTIKNLDEIVRADMDIYRVNSELNPGVTLDLSTTVIIEGLKQFEQNQKFLIESEMLSIVLRDIGNDRKRKFKLSEYFDICPGRMDAKPNKNNFKIIKKEQFGNNSFFFKINFAYNIELVRAVRQLPGARFNREKRYWGVPSRYENEVIEFANKYEFSIIAFFNPNYINKSSIEFNRGDIPNGIYFCEGIKAQRQQYNKDFWWCANRWCFESHENLHSSKEWKKYTLLDFLNILGYSVVETGIYGAVELGLYNKFISQVNRFNQLLERLYCEECENILYPLNIAIAAAYGVTRFCCENDKCKLHKKEIYLSHCLNNQCNSIIDSRESKRCPNGLVICKYCGSCCSHSMFEGRMKKLSITGRRISDDLINKINNKEGHFEKAEYYCYSCGGMMTMSKSNTEFICNVCNIEYDTTKYYIKRPHLHLRRKDYPSLEDD